MNLGNIDIADLWLGQLRAKSAWIGDVQVWSDAPAYLCFTAQQASSTVHLDKNGSPDAIYLETSTDGETWTDYEWSGNTGDTLTLANVGDKVYMRAKTENQTIGSSVLNYYKFVMSGQIAASGNIQTLLKADDSRTDAPAYCYCSMFRDCTSLTTAPTLKATTLGSYCYDSMFYGCTSLTTTPALPATTLAEGCYSYMFINCSSLTAAPSLPATTLASSCYSYMFQNCTSLTAAPSLPATTLAATCYSNMFSGCTSLNLVGVAFTTWTSGATDNWLNNVAATGTFKCPTDLPDERGVDYIPTGWTKAKFAEPVTFTALNDNARVKLVKNGAPDAISIEYSTDGNTWSYYTLNNYISMNSTGDKVYFRAKNENQTFSKDGSNYYVFKCGESTSYGNVEVSGNLQTLLKADGTRTDVPSYCFNRLFFQNQYNLLRADGLELPATTLAQGCYSNMFNTCYGLTTSPKILPAQTLAANCYSNMFQNCRVMISVPELPATALASWCYSNMFYYCTTIAKAPRLPATSLASGCYNQMFYSCSNLKYVEVCFSSWSDATTNWFTSASSTGEFVCPADLPVERSNSKIPTSWSVRQPQPLCFTFLEAGQVSLMKTGTPTAINVEWSDDGSTWQNFSDDGQGNLVAQIQTAGNLYVRASSPNQTFSTDSSNYWHFAVSSSNEQAIVVSGDVQTLLDGNILRHDAKSYCFYRLLLQCTQISNASGLKLYADQLSAHCYDSMFYGCTSLTTAPELTATTLADGCYDSMFYGCTSLTAAPDLPAQTLADNCYSSMFYNCSSISSIIVNFTDWNASGNATNNWFGGTVPQSGAFNCPYGLDLTVFSASRVPTGWTVPTLQAVEYIQSSGTQFINTGILPDKNTKIQFKFQNLQQTGVVILGNYTGGNGDYRMFNTGGNAYFDIAPNRLSRYGVIPLNTWLEFEMGNYYMKDLVSGSNVLGPGTTQLSYAGTLPIYVNGNTEYSKNKWNYLKIYDGETLVRDFVAMRFGTTGVLYDNVSGQVFSSEGTEPFIAGPDVNA